jgi:transcriptional regulator with XRE-family HTH domain
VHDETLRTWLTGVDGLSTRLRSLRINAGLTGQQLAEAFGTHSAKVSRIEHGRQLATPSDIRIWTEACGANHELDDLLDLLTQSQAVELSWRNRLQAGMAGSQREHNRIVEQASLVQNLSMLWIPGLLQTGDYARAILSFFRQLHDVATDDVEDAVQARLHRQRLLDKPGRDFEIVMWEPVLRSQPVSPAVMIPQIERIIDVAERPNVRLGVIPIDRQLQAFTSASVDIYDGEVAFTELAPTSVTHTSPEDLSAHTKVYAMAWTDAVEGNEARSLILAAADRYR